MKIEQKLAEMGWEVVDLDPPGATFEHAKRVGNLVFTTAQAPRVKGEYPYKGKAGDLPLEDVEEAARTAVFNCLMAVRGLIGDLDDVVQIVKLTGYIASLPGFQQQPTVIDAASQLVIDLYGDAGRHVRAAVGVSELAHNVPLVIELVAEVKA